LALNVFATLVKMYIDPRNAFKIMQMLENNLIFDTLDAILINRSVHTLIQSHMHNLY
jgi:hypothetical protein